MSVTKMSPMRVLVTIYNFKTVYTKFKTVYRLKLIFYKLLFLIVALKLHFVKANCIFACFGVIRIAFNLLWSYLNIF